MISDLDIWRAAHMLIERHGESAEIEALKMHAEMLIRVDAEGVGIWSRIRRAIHELQAQSEGLPH